MRKPILMLFLVALAAEWALGQKIPEGVQTIIDNYKKDSMVDYGFLFVKRGLHLDPSLKSTDIEVGVPIAGYRIRYDVLDTCSVEIPVSALIEPRDHWYLPIRAHGKYIYEIEISKSSGYWKRAGCVELGSPCLWEFIRKSYPESSGINPIVIMYGGDLLYHFPQKGDFNLFSVRGVSPNDSLSIVSSKSFDSLDDSRKIIKYLKKEWNDGRERRKEMFKDAPNPFEKEKKHGGEK